MRYTKTKISQGPPDLHCDARWEKQIFVLFEMDAVRQRSLESIRYTTDLCFPREVF